jgi:hypothetical protein
VKRGGWESLTDESGESLHAELAMWKWLYGYLIREDAASRRPIFIVLPTQDRRKDTPKACPSIFLSFLGITSGPEGGVHTRQSSVTP